MMFKPTDLLIKPPLFSLTRVCSKSQVHCMERPGETYSSCFFSIRGGLLFGDNCSDLPPAWWEKMFFYLFSRRSNNPPRGKMSPPLGGAERPPPPTNNPGGGAHHPPKPKKSQNKKKKKKFEGWGLFRGGTK